MVSLCGRAIYSEDLNGLKWGKQQHKEISRIFCSENKGATRKCEAVSNLSNRISFLIQSVRARVRKIHVERNIQKQTAVRPSMEKSHSHKKESTLKPFESQDPCLCLTHLSYSSRTFERRASGDRNLNHRSELVFIQRDSNERENEEELESRVIEEEGLPIRNRVALAFMAPVYSFCFLINTVPVNSCEKKNAPKLLLLFLLECFDTVR